MKKGISIWQVDAFAERPFAGNPAAVCILGSFPSDAWMQSLAAEMNLSETSFIVPTGDTNSFQLRWFTPTTEVDLCGHATLAAAHTLIEQERIESSLPIRFQTRSGELPCTQSGSRITLDFPAKPATDFEDTEKRAQLLAALGIPDASVHQSKFDLLVKVDDSDIVETLRPNFQALGEVQTRGVMVTAASQTLGFDFVSRFFAPRCGINEDPVTGSAHCCLAPYWADRIGRKSLVGYQASPRGGVVHCEVADDRVRLTGQAITILEGTLRIEPA